MDEKLELRLIAMADQINASHRDALKAFHSFAEHLAKLPSEHQQRAVNDMSWPEQVCTYIIADETDAQWVIDLLPVEARLLVESWSKEEER